VPWAVLAVLIQLQNGKIGVADFQLLQNYVQGYGAPQCHNGITCLWTPGRETLLALRYSAPDFMAHVKAIMYGNNNNIWSEIAI
jgi:hypothetical protein